MIGVIGGSGLYGIPGFEVTGERRITTPYGEPSAPFTIGRIGEVEVAFLPRHGAHHSVAPHKINYRANLRGFKEIGVERIIAVYATGGIADWLAPGDLLVPDQILDMTAGARIGTFYEEGEIVHVDFTEPYCPELRSALGRAAGGIETHIHGGGTYLCVQGPRLETRREIEFYRSIGGDVVGMTGMPEAALARELEICFSALCVVTNHAAGISARKLTTEEVRTTMAAANERIKTLLAATFKAIPNQRACPCKDALSSARM